MLPCIAEPRKEVSEYRTQDDLHEDPRGEDPRGHRLRRQDHSEDLLLRPAPRSTSTTTAPSSSPLWTLPACKAAKAAIDNICFVPEVGKLYYGKVVRIIPIGAFVELVPGKDGMIHISKLENHRVEKVEDVLNVGDMTWVKVTDIDEKGRVNLSRRDALKEMAKNKQ